MHQRMKETRRRLSRLGCQIRLTQKGHLRIEHVALTRVVFTSGTPSGLPRARQSESDAAPDGRAGLTLPEWVIRALGGYLLG
jgi:hypothetical protein